ncbi:MAG: hypothetical protein E7173_03520 [Firmicutes bacterium]|nr:hypothetical protein [Bacillota bacterium]
MFLNSSEFWIIVYLISAVIFAQYFKTANRNMQNAGKLTILLQFFSAIFALLVIILFPIKISLSLNVYITLIIVTIIYAITDRLNIEARYGLPPSTFSMLKQLSTVFIIIFGIVLLKEEVVVTKIVGAVVILVSNLLLAYEKRKFVFNKYFMMSVAANFLFAVAMIININISSQFNIGIYTFITLFIPALWGMLLGRYTVREIKQEFNLYDKKKIIMSAFMWSLMLISSVKAYEYGNIVVVATLFTLTGILNAFVEFVMNKNVKELVKKIIIFIFLVIGVLLVRVF